MSLATYVLTHANNLTTPPLSATSTYIPTPSTSANATTDTFCQSFRFYVNVVSVSVVTGFGLVGNTLSVVVLQKERCHRTTRLLLQALAIADNLLLMTSFLILTIIDGTLPHVISNVHTIKALFGITLSYLHPFAFMPLVATIWFTVLIAINRYIVVCHPLRASSLCSLSKTRLQVLLISVISVLVNMPRFFQFELEYSESGHIIGSKHTPIGTKSTFGIVYNNFVYNIVVLIAPVLILMPLSFRLVLELKRMQQRREAMAMLVAQTAPTITFRHYCNTSASKDKIINGSYMDIPTKRVNHQNQDENNITYVTVMIMIVLIICHTPDRALQILKLSKKRIAGCSTGSLYYFSLLCNIFVLLNSSANFLIYYLIRRRFRHRLFVMLGLRKHSNSMNGTSTPNYTESLRSRTCSNQSLHRVYKDGVYKYKSDLHVNSVLLNIHHNRNMFERRNTS